MAEVMDFAPITSLPRTLPDAPSFDEAAGSLETLSQRAVLLKLTVSAWGTDRQLKAEQYQVDADKSMTRARKKLLISPELDAIRSLDSKARTWLASKSLPSPLRLGMYLQPLANVEEVDAYLVDFEARRPALVEEFLGAYPDRVAEARLRLRRLFDSRNYPTPEALRRRFQAAHAYLEMPSAPGSLRSVSSYLFHREQEKARQVWEGALEDARVVLRTQLAALLNHLVEKLEPGENGKPRKFHDTLVTNLEEWLKSFRDRNLTNDRELQTLVERTRDLLHPTDDRLVTGPELRTDSGLRQYLHTQFEQLKRQVDALVTERPPRRIRLDD